MPGTPESSLTDQIVIRHADSSQREALIELKRGSALANPADRVQLMKHPDAIDVPHEHVMENRVLVAMVEARVLGFATVLPRPDGDAELDALFVEPQAWRRGIGKAFVDSCMAEAARCGAKALHVISNPHARSFYDTCGFAACGTRDMPFGKGILMKKFLR